MVSRCHRASVALDLMAKLAKSLRQGPIATALLPSLRPDGHFSQMAAQRHEQFCQARSALGDQHISGFKLCADQLQAFLQGLGVVINRLHKQSHSTSHRVGKQHKCQFWASSGEERPVLSQERTAPYLLCR